MAQSLSDPEKITIHWFKDVIPRKLKLEGQRLVFPISRRKLLECFTGLGLQKEAVVCVHSSLSALGYIRGGATTVIETLMQSVTRSGCVAMPTFSINENMKNTINEMREFDVRQSPSTVGLITEVFRNCPGVLRSLHPTHSVSAWGNGAAELIEGHEKSITPFGPRTPYGKLANNENAFILMFGTRLLSLPHLIQERADFPNLFLPEIREVSLIDSKGDHKFMTTRIMRPNVPYKVAVPAAIGQEPDWCLIHDFCLLFPRKRERILKRQGRALGYRKLWNRRAELEKLGILRTARLGRGEVGLLGVKPFIDLIVPELKDLIQRFGSSYPTLT